jgi:hypothetical protein
MPQPVSDNIYKCNFCDKKFFTFRGAVIHENRYCKKNVQRRKKVKDDPRLGMNLFEGAV